MSSVMNAPLIELRGIRRIYGGGDTPATEVLRGIDVTIHAGEYVAIVGSSGSGKSTLMNVLGLLDRPTQGRYEFAGRDVSQLSADEQAWLRRERFGFVFQQYHLVRTESALANVEIPAIYAGMQTKQRRERAESLLQRLSLGERMHHRPAQLSGGQQQRVSIARALMNGGEIILADEPTGALDSRSGREVLELFDELSAAGHTIILITHDHAVAQRARRVIEIKDGRIVSDTGPSVSSNLARSTFDGGATERVDALGSSMALLKSSWRSLWSNRFRTMLTLLGIVIGVASVLVMLAIGEGSKRRVIAQMSAFGSNLLIVSSQRPAPRAAPGVITREDVQALAQLPEVEHVMPQMHGPVTVRYGNTDYETSARGVGLAMPRIQHWSMQLGVFFDERDERKLAPVVVLGQVVRQALFPAGLDPIGRYVLINSKPYQVIGVLAEKGATSGEADDDDVVAMPFTTASARVFGRRNPGFAVVAAADAAAVERVERSVRELMMARHRVEDFRIRNRAAMIAAEARTQDTLSLLQALTAAISLLVGGIGVMNVMLMAVRERTREIGIRIATGARQRDILRQFLLEAGLVSSLGAGIGLAIALVIGATLACFDVALVFSVRVMIPAVACALATGFLFGFLPARRAARMDPVVALAGE